MVHGTCERPAAAPPLRCSRVTCASASGTSGAVRDAGGGRGPGRRPRRFLARLDDLPVAVTAVTLRARCAYDLVVVTPPDTAASAAADFDRLVLSFQLTGGA